MNRPKLCVIVRNVGSIVVFSVKVHNRHFYSLSGGFFCCEYLDAGDVFVTFYNL